MSEPCIDCGYVHLPGYCGERDVDRFSYNDVMAALGQAFQRAGSRTSRDCRVEEYMREILSDKLYENSTAPVLSGREKRANVTNL